MALDESGLDSSQLDQLLAKVDVMPGDLDFDEKLRAVAFENVTKCGNRQMSADERSLGADTVVALMMLVNGQRKLSEKIRGLTGDVRDFRAKVEQYAHRRTGSKVQNRSRQLP
jgi:hypothetical protein